MKAARTALKRWRARALRRELVLFFARA